MRFMKKEINLVVILFVFFLGGSIQGELTPWAELETQESQIKKLVVELKGEIEVLQKKLSGVLTTEERFLLQEELRMKQKDFMNHQVELRKVQQQIQFRFPERGLLLNKTLSDSIEFPSPEGVKSQPSGTNNLDPETRRDEKLIKQKDNSADEALESLRRQYGRPLDELEKKELLIKQSNPKKQNPLDQKIILSK